MPFKINIGTKEGKTFKLEADAPALEGKELGQTIKGEDISPDFSGYEFEIKGASDKSGFTAMQDVEGFALKRVLLDYGKGMHKKPKGDKKKGSKPLGLRLRKTVRGKVLSSSISQINLKLIKEGSKKLTEMFPDQNKAPEPEVPEKSSEQAPEADKETKEAPAQDQTNPEKEPESSKKDIEEASQPNKEPQ